MGQIVARIWLNLSMRVVPLAAISNIKLNLQGGTRYPKRSSVASLLHLPAATHLLPTSCDFCEIPKFSVQASRKSSGSTIASCH